MCSTIALLFLFLLSGDLTLHYRVRKKMHYTVYRFGLFQYICIYGATKYHVNYAVSVSFVGLVVPVLYGSADTLRQMFNIVKGRCMFGVDRFSSLNIAGILTTQLGALLYTWSPAPAKGVCHANSAGYLVFKNWPHPKCG